MSTKMSTRSVRKPSTSSSTTVFVPMSPKPVSRSKNSGAAQDPVQRKDHGKAQRDCDPQQKAAHEARPRRRFWPANRAATRSGRAPPSIARAAVFGQCMHQETRPHPRRE